jgi:hypothetical protein
LLGAHASNEVERVADSGILGGEIHKDYTAVLSGQELLEAASLGVFRLASLLGKVQFAVDGAIEGG